MPFDEAALTALGSAGPPLNHQQLNERVTRIARALDVTEQRARTLICGVIAAQLLPSGVLVKGGVGIKLRLGETGTRATRDVDVVAPNRDSFEATLTESLRRGWGKVPASKGQRKRNSDAPPRVAFTGDVRARQGAQPAGVPPEYVMQPYDVTLNFLGKPWARVPVEVAHDELDGSTLVGAPAKVAAQLVQLGQALAVGPFAEILLIALEQQIAQKIHAATHPGSERAHDLVDLQLLWQIGQDDGMDLTLLRAVCQRTFAYRDTHPWPPTASMPAALKVAYLAPVRRPASTMPTLLPLPSPSTMPFPG